ncbi:cortical protein marker for cell polarity-domain-containing protein [Abortiporus biennis]|nr:cortical protein marker for cell polarity-domain-containing protein [Abortiporus biennis]
MKSKSRSHPSISTFMKLPLVLLYATFAHATLPLVDFDRMGKVGLTGSFTGLTFVSNSSDAASFDPSTSTIFSRSSDGLLTRLASTDPGGSVSATCSLGDKLYIAGNFSSIGGIQAANIAVYDPSSDSFASVGSSGPNGDVLALFCDQSHNKIWAGGKFTSPGSSVAIWDESSTSWAAAPFGGLAGSSAEVFSITTNSSGSSLFFAGSFITSFTNGSVSLNGTNNPNVPFSSGASPFSSSLVPVPLGNAQINPSDSSPDPNFSNISNILCPSGSDGPGNTWLARDGSEAVITVRKFSFISASGIRIGNTFLEGRGTTGFTLTTIPDNTVQTLQFVDPHTGGNVTCNDPCPLLVDSTVPYQDFLFPGVMDVTGFQLKLSEWQGAGPGLHLLQLLSSGAFATSIDADNGVSCFAPNPSTTSRTGTWTEKDANTNIPGTTQAVLVSEIAVGTQSSQSPTFTWMPYVSASGEYVINLLVPGCTNFQDCAARTSVKVTVFPGAGVSPFVTTLSQQNTEDASVEIYRGPVVLSSSSFATTITMTLADTPTGNGQNGQYELVADRVELLLNTPSNGGNGTSGLNGTSTARNSFGFLEWPLSSTATANAVSSLNTSQETGLDVVGFDLFDAIGSSIPATSHISAVAHHSSGAIVVAGDFKLASGSASGASNIALFKSGQLNALSGGGLDGPVASVALTGDSLFVGGAFQDTATPTTQGKLSGVALYNVQQNTWTSLGGGVNGPVSSISLSDNQLLVAGNFTSVSQGNLQVPASGYAVWNVSSNSWGKTGGFVVGNLTFVGNGTSSTDLAQIVAGRVSAAAEVSAPGFVMLQNGNGNDGIPSINSPDFSLGSQTAQTTLARRSLPITRTHSWLPTVRHIFRRQNTPAQTSLPSSSTPTSSILTGAFWVNGSSSNDAVIVGGNFSLTTATGTVAENLAVYDPTTDSIRALSGNQISGTVLSLLVEGNQLFVGGTFTVPGTQFNGFAVYDLADESWDTTGVEPLQSGSSTDVVVRSVTNSPSQSNTIIVAGFFAQAGSTPCRSICAYGTQTKQWNALGDGIQGDVHSVAYAGSTRDIIVAGGSIALADSTVANVAEFSVSNGTWTAVGAANALPGAVTAVEVNDGNVNSIFAAGRNADGTSTFLSFWNGQSWNAIGSDLQQSSSVSQLLMVPLQNTHSANSVVESDRMLLISGTLSDPSFGQASSALFDGQNIIPYIVTTSSSGTPGTVSSLVKSLANFSFNQRHLLATGIVILISIAISAGVVFLLALIGILWTLFARRDDKVRFDPGEVEDDEDSTHRPSSLLEHINAATRTTILGSSAFDPNMVEKEVGIGASTSASERLDRDPFAMDVDGSNYQRAETPSDAIMGTMIGEEEPSRPAHARYSFDGEGEGELRLVAGQEIEVLDDGDPAWWYARDPRTGREGVVPAAYVY